MKKLILLTCLSIMSSAFAVEGVFVPEFELPKGQILVTEGFRIKSGIFQSLDVTIDENGVQSISNSGYAIGAEESFISSEEYETVVPADGHITGVYCRTQYGKAVVAGDDLEVTRFSLEVKHSCPLSKQQSKRGLSFGKLNERVLRFKEVGSDAILENVYGSHKITQKLVRIQ